MRARTSQTSRRPGRPSRRPWRTSRTSRNVLEQLTGAAWRAQLRSDVDLLTAAAAALRHAATQGAYRGRREPDRAYAIASVLDLAGLRWRDQDPALRVRLRAYSRLLLDTTPPPARPPDPP